MTLDIAAIRQTLNFSTPDWRPDIVRLLITRMAEGPLFDRKEALPLVSCSKDELHKAEQSKLDSIQGWIVDVISMMNSARHRGRSAYMVFGVKDDWTLNEYGVLNSTTFGCDIRNIERFLVSESEFVKLQIEIILNQDLLPPASRFVAPDPTSYIQFEFGWLEMNGKPYLLSYIKFKPIITAQPFMVAPKEKPSDRMWLEKLRLRATDIYSRVRDTNKLFTGEDLENLVSFQTIPFLSVSALRQYVEHEKRAVEGRLKSHYQDIELVGKQVLLVEEQESHEKIEAVTAVLTMLRARSHPNALYLLGEGGAGKSTVICEVAATLLKDLQDVLTLLQDDEQPTCLMPIFLDLSQIGTIRNNLEAVASASLSSLIRDYVEWPDRVNPEKIFASQYLHFAVLIDALDELEPREVPPTIKEILRFIKVHPNVRVVVTARNEVFRTSQMASSCVMKLMAFERAQVVSRLQASERLAMVYDAIIETLGHDDELFHLLSNPRMLGAIASKFNTSVRVSLANLLKDAIKEYINIEEQKYGIYSEPVVQYERLTKLAEKIWLQGNISEGIYCPSPKAYRRLISAGFLVYQDHIINFRSPYLLYYLLAQELECNPGFLKKNLGHVEENADYHAQIIAFAADWCIQDLTDKSHWVGRCLGKLSNPRIPIDALLNRRNSNLADSDVVGQWINTYAAALSSKEELERQAPALVYQLLKDNADAVFNAVINLLADRADLRRLISPDYLLNMLSQDSPNSRFDRLLYLLRDHYGIDISTYSEVMLKRILNSPADAALLFEFFDWTDGVPTVLLQAELLGSTADDQIKEAVLLRLGTTQAEIPPQWHDAIVSLTESANPNVQPLARKLLGMERKEPTATQETSALEEEPYSEPKVLETLSPERNE